MNQKLKAVNKIFDMSNKNVIIFGGAGKIGKNFSKILSAAGANVFILDLSCSKKILSKKIFFLKCDVSSETQINSSIEKIINKFKKIDVLIYNVYSKPKNYYKKFTEYDSDTWKTVIDINLTGAFLATKYLISLKKNKKLNFIFLLSTYGIVGPDYKIYENLSAKKNIYDGNYSLNTPAVYSASKSALLGFAKYISTTYGKDGVRCNCLTPGGVFDNQEKKFIKRYEHKVPLGRMANQNDYNGAILFLASDASSYMTGSNLIVDGGWTAW
jgi:2-deoxy-D-gluconate 3-dehydrogenase